MKRKRIALLTFENFNDEIQNILLNSEIDYLIFLYFTSNMSKNKIFWKIPENISLTFKKMST